MYNATGMNVMGSCVLYHYAHRSTQAQTYNIVDTEGSVLLSCADTFALELGLASNKLSKMIPSGTKLVFSQADWK